jgi:crotonobetainyl-CoA:carnitine CoA-transferase CaiB-like acyl-CoA transferase
MTLDGYTVLDVSTGLAGAYCTKLLADGGATIIKVEPPAGDPLRRWSETGGPIPSGEDGALFQYLSTSKQSVVATADVEADVGMVRALVAFSDIIVWSAGSPIG